MKKLEIKKDLQIERQETSVFDVLGKGFVLDHPAIEFSGELVYLGFVFMMRGDDKRYVVEPFRVPEPTARERQDTEMIYHHRLQNSICVGVVQTSEREYLARRIEYFLDDYDEYTASKEEGTYALQRIFELGKRVVLLTQCDGAEFLSEETADRMLFALKENDLIPQDFSFKERLQRRMSQRRGTARMKGE